MKKSPLAFLAAALIFSSNHSLSAAPIATLFSTGMADATTPLPDNAVDPHYTLTQVPPGAPFGPATYVADSAQYPLSTNEWLANSSTSKWIAAQADQSTFPNDPGSGDYVFHTTFDLTGFDPATAQIAGQWTMDNYSADLLLNGVSTGIHALEPSLTSFESFSITTGFIVGLNTLDFLVHNEPFFGPVNPMGLRVELSGTADLVPEPASPAIIVTGLLSATLVAGRRNRAALRFD